LEKAVDNIKIGDKVGTVMRRAVSQITQSSFATVKGRKALIILTDGKDFGSYLTRNELLEQLQESDVMVYTVFYKTGMDFSKPLANQNLNVSDEKKPKAKKVKKQKGFSLDLPDGDFPSEEEVRQREKQEDLEAIDALKKMSDTTAGRFYQRDVTDLKNTFDQIADELRKQYRLSYYSTASDKTSGARDLQIKVARPDVVVRSRDGLRLK
jgi:VWFA-related protein